jgi:hypothetical protein
MGYVVAALLTLGLVQASASQSTPSQKRQVLQPQVLVTTLSADEVMKQTASTAIEHDTEVSRHEPLTIVLTIAECEKGENGMCNASADVVAHKPDGSVHTQLKNVSLNNRRATAALTLSPGDPTGLYKVVATVRDLNARRFGTAERIFGVK